MASGSTDMSTREFQITALTTWRAGTIMAVMTLGARIGKYNKTTVKSLRKLYLEQVIFKYILLPNIESHKI